MRTEPRTKDRTASPLTGQPVPSAQARAETVALDLFMTAFATLSPAAQDEVLRRLRGFVQ